MYGKDSEIYNGKIIYIHTYIHDCDNITGQVLSIDSLPVTAWWKLLLMGSMFFQPECIYVYNIIYMYIYCIYIYISISKKNKSLHHMLKS